MLVGVLPLFEDFILFFHIISVVIIFIYFDVSLSLASDLHFEAMITRVNKKLRENITYKTQLKMTMMAWHNSPSGLQTT